MAEVWRTPISSSQLVLAFIMRLKMQKNRNPCLLIGQGEI